MISQPSFSLPSNHSVREDQRWTLAQSGFDWIAACDAILVRRTESETKCLSGSESDSAEAVRPIRFCTPFMSKLQKIARRIRVGLARRNLFHGNLARAAMGCPPFPLPLSFFSSWRKQSIHPKSPRRSAPSIFPNVEGKAHV